MFTELNFGSLVPLENFEILLGLVSPMRTEMLYRSLMPSPSQQTHEFKCQHPEGRASVWKCGSVCEQHCW